MCMAMQSSTVSTATKHGVVQPSIALLQERFRQLQKDKEMRQQKELLRNATAAITTATFLRSSLDDHEPTGPIIIDHNNNNPPAASTTTTSTITTPLPVSTTTIATDLAVSVTLQNYHDNHHLHHWRRPHPQPPDLPHRHHGCKPTEFKLFFDNDDDVSPNTSTTSPPLYEHISLSLWPVSDQHQGMVASRPPSVKSGDHLQTDHCHRQHANGSPSNDLTLVYCSCMIRFKSDDDQSVPIVDTSLRL